MSLLGNKIKKYRLNSEEIAKKVMEHYFEQFKELNNGVHSVDTFEAFICREDNNGFWEEVLMLSYCGKEWLANEIGIIMHFPEPGVCTIKYSGK